MSLSSPSFNLLSANRLKFVKFEMLWFVEGFNATEP